MSAPPGPVGSPASAPAPRLLLADADAFYVAVARLVDPAGAGQAPLLIVGGAAERRGVVTSASYEARAYGVRSAMPMARALRLCPGATVVPVPWEACAAKSRDIRAVLLRFTPVVEQASSDEFYLDLSGTEALYRGEPLAETALRIRAAVVAETTLQLSIGGGTSKLVAKLAAGIAKPRPGTAGAPADGVYVVPPGDEAAFMARFTLADLPGIGPKSAARLARLGLRSVPDVVRRDPLTLVRWLGEREGSWLYERVRGIDRGTVEPEREAKSISRDETFPVDVDEDEALAAKLLALADRASADLREAGLAARTVTVKLRDDDFTTRQASRTLGDAVQSDRAVFAVARRLLARLRAARRRPARLVGVSLSGFLPAAGDGQLSFFDQAGGAGASAGAGSAEGAAGGAETARDRAIAAMIDDVRERFGPDALGRAGGR